MSAFTVYTTDANPQLLYSGERATEADERVDGWVDQLARVTGQPVDLFVDVPGGRVVWTMLATRGERGRTGRYLADYTVDGDEPIAAVFDGLHDRLAGLRDGDGWTFTADEPRWRAAFDLPDLPAACPGLDDADEDALAAAVGDADGQLVVGMSSYDAALRTVKHLTERGVAATLAINSDGATAETEGVDLVLWPGADADFAPMDESTRDALVAAGFAPARETDVVDETPASDRAVVQDRHERPSALESFVGDGIGRIGVGMSVILSVATVGSLAAIQSLYPASGLSAIGGVIGATAGLVASRAGLDSIASATPTETDGGAVDSSNDWAWQQYGAFFGFYLLFGYAFLTVFRLAGWPFGVTEFVVPTALSAAVYAGAILLVSLALRVAWGLRSGESPEATDLVPVVAINVLFGVGLVASTGLACAVWYGVIGFSGGPC
ncbi:hypothetical protein Hbl1158_14690 [Halobaculum sp. CBA1158]|uniref:hypothetical protein n=1 Tax=Halobaculum sp. CBA1158 TaxID=2904243 RepID=UPI001F45E857|nr:hypothetical protein [Halobaculum sp. CBA1158]UIO99748.1 hypothetical protein Hbl1158_14690 [Halobaculum sp. CBA1158]